VGPIFTFGSDILVRPVLVVAAALPCAVRVRLMAFCVSGGGLRACWRCLLVIAVLVLAW
jgi:hypothetical protein